MIFFWIGVLISNRSRTGMVRGRCLQMFPTQNDAGVRPVVLTGPRQFSNCVDCPSRLLTNFVQTVNDHLCLVPLDPRKPHD